MKKLFFICCFLYSFAVNAELKFNHVGATNYSYSQVGDKYTFYLFSQFAFGSGAGPNISGYLTEQSNDTLFIKALYNTKGKWASWYGVSYDTIRNIVKSSSINYFTISSNSYDYDPTDGFPSTDTSWNDDDSTFYVGPTAIIEKNTENLFAVFPNPAADRINICTAQGLSWASVKVYGVFGQLVLQQDREQMDNSELNISGLSSGLYFLSLHDKNGTSSGILKFHKQ